MSDYIDKVWGHEEIICNHEYCGKILRIVEGYQCSLHKHEIKDETFYILSGVVHLELNDDIRKMMEGEHIRVLPGELHRFRGITDAEILEISTHDDPSDSYREPGEESRRV